MPSFVLSMSFQQIWRAGRRVKENAPPHRTGSIRAVQGTGLNASIVVNVDGSHPVTFKQAQLTPTF